MYTWKICIRQLFNFICMFLQRKTDSFEDVGISCLTKYKLCLALSRPLCFMLLLCDHISYLI
jgi:hypothetical protein